MAIRERRGTDPLGGADTRGGWIAWLLAGVVLIAAVAVVMALVIGSGEDDADRRASSSLTANGTPLLPVKPGSLKPLVGQSVTGTLLKVQAVNAKEGFWVGTSATDRIYVEYGEDEAGSFIPQVDATVD